jgi:hypothetical protein
MCDRLLSAADLRVVHDGASFNRIVRTEAIARHDEALTVLQVCSRNGHGQGNCGHCSKCLRTMILLDLLGAKGRAATFDWSTYSTALLRRIWLPHQNEQFHFLDIAALADHERRAEVAAAVRESAAFSRRRAAIQKLVKGNSILRTAWKSARRLWPVSLIWSKLRVNGLSKPMVTPPVATAAASVVSPAIPE